MRELQNIETVQDESGRETRSDCTSMNVGILWQQKLERSTDVGVQNVFRAARDRDWSRVVWRVNHGTINASRSLSKSMRCWKLQELRGGSG
jgi:hypothetical protein